jgi:MFS family permease
MATEYAPPRLRGVFAGLASCGVAAGVATGNLVYLVMNLTTSPEWFQSFGWRIPFMLSILLIGVGLYFRFNIGESPAFIALQKKSAPKQVPFLELIVHHWPKVLRVLLLTMFMSSIGYVGQVFLVAYATSQLQVAPPVLLGAAIIANILEVPATVFSGWLSDRVGRKAVYLPTVVIGLLFSFAVFPLVNTASWIGIAIAVIGLRLITAGMYGPQGALFSEMFNTEVRYSGVALGFAVSTTIAAVIVSFLFAGSAGGTFLPTVFITICAIVTLMTGLTITEQSKRDLTDQSAT